MILPSKTVLCVCLALAMSAGCRQSDNTLPPRPSVPSATARGSVQSVPNNRPVALVPLMIGSDGRMYVKTVIEGSVEGTFLIDTGNALDSLSTAVQYRLHLPTSGVAGQMERRWVSPKLSIGGKLNVQQVAFVLQAPARLPMCALTGRPVDGIIGAYLLDRFDVLFDVAGHRMAVWSPPGLTMDEIRAAGLKVLGTVPIAPYRTGAGVWGTKVRLTRKSASADEEMILDTGAQTTVISRVAAARLGLTASEGAQAIIYQNRSIPVGTGRLTRLQVGDFALDNRRVYFPADRVSDCPVSLGMDVLGSRPALVEFGRGMVYLVAPSAKGSKTP